MRSERFVNTRWAVAGLAALLWGAATAAAGTVHRVPDQYPTIRDALDAAEPGDTVQVAAGVYPEHLGLTGRTDLTLRGSRATIDAGGMIGIDAVNCTGLTITGFTITNAHFGIMLDHCSGVAVSKCALNGCAQAGIRGEYSEDVLVSGCTMDGNPRAVWDVTSTRLTITKCRITDSASFGIILSENGVGGGSADAVVEKNVILDSGDTGIRVAGAGIVIRGNTVAGAGTWGISVDPSGETGGVVVSKNRVSGAEITGINATRDTRVEKNTVADSGVCGIEMWGDGTIAGNKVSGSGGAGVKVEGTGTRVLKNKVSGSDWSGIWWRVDGGRAEGNKVSASGDSGFLVEGTASTFRKNSSKGCGAGWTDLWSVPVREQNTWEANRFPSESFGALVPKAGPGEGTED